ncbi:MAG TPA: CBS domain-containing protein [Euzebya sp.]|nr:CBS domain-containing protein [Euzebya sp.]
MERWVCARRTVKGDPSRLKERLTTEVVSLLQRATGSDVTPPAGDASFAMVLATEGEAFHKMVSASVGQAQTSRDGRLRIPVAWKADPLSGIFPTFRGDIEVEDLDRGTISIALVGRYRPPGSVLGGVADRLLFGSNADAVTERIARGLATALAEEIPAGPAAALPAMRVGDVMTPDPLVLGEDLSLRAAANLMVLGRISGAPVVDDDGLLVGILSEADVLDKVAPLRTGLSRRVEMSWRRHDAVTVGQACSRPARTTSVDATVRDAAQAMATHDVARLVVMRGATVAGIVTRHDVLKSLIRSDEAIESAVEAVICARGFDGVVAEVVDGHVRLSGMLERRTDAAQLPVGISELDGVLDVDASALRWQHDDVVPPPALWV